MTVVVQLVLAALAGFALFIGASLLLANASEGTLPFGMEPTSALGLLGVGGLILGGIWIMRIGRESDV